MDWILVFMDFIGILGFIIACIYAWKNYYLTKFASPMWFIFGMAMALGAFFAFATLLDISGFYSEVMDEVIDCLFCIMIGILVVFSIISRGSEIKPM